MRKGSCSSRFHLHHKDKETYIDVCPVLRSCIGPNIEFSKRYSENGFMHTSDVDLILIYEVVTVERKMVYLASTLQSNL